MDLDSKNLVAALLGESEHGLRILRKYPVRNNLWEPGKDGETFTAWSSELHNHDENGGKLDPWNRPVSARWTEERDEEGDIAAWHTVVTVAGIPVKLLVFND